jgi:protein-tyrosine phosphatase
LRRPEKRTAQRSPLSLREEIAEKSLQYAHAVKHGETRLPEMIEAPTPDFGVPGEEATADFCAAPAEARQKISEGVIVPINCGTGRGRTRTYAAALPCEVGFPLKAALKMVAAARSGPETE